MKMMLLGDTHGNTAFTKKALALASYKGADVVIQLGDFGVWPRGGRFLDQVGKLAKDLNIPLLFLDGNHEDFDQLYALPIGTNGLREVRGPWVSHIPRGTVFGWDGVTFLGMGGAHSIDGPGGIWRRARGPGKGWWPEETITDEEVARAQANVELAGGRVDVLLSHDAPHGVPIPGIEGYKAATENRKRLRQVFDSCSPQLVVHGHYHKHYQAELEGSRVIGLAHDGGSNHDMVYAMLDTDPFTLHLPVRGSDGSNKGEF